MGARARNWAGALVKRAGNAAGVEISRHRPRGHRRDKLLAAYGIELVLDVGANRGQYARELRDYGYAGRIVSFEPAREAFASLRKRSAADERWSVHQLAASDQDAAVELGVADNFSSLLPVEERLAALFPQAAQRRPEVVRTCRLDATEIELPTRRAALLKLDVQGHEHKALAGATGILDRIAVIEIELSVVPLYRGQPLLSDIVCLLDAQGFQLMDLDPILRDRRTGEYVQFDGVFVERRASATISSIFDSNTPRANS